MWSCQKDHSMTLGSNQTVDAYSTMISEAHKAMNSKVRTASHSMQHVHL